MNKQLQQLGNNLLLGTLVLAPLAITVLIIRNLFAFLTGWFVNVAPDEFQTGFRSYIARVVVLLFVLVILFLIGLLARNLVGQRLYELGDSLLSRTPGVKLFYNFFRQIIEVFFANRDASFKEVVLIEYPSPGMFMLGFVTSTLPERYRADITAAPGTDEYVSVFIPMTPLPTSGWYVIVPRTKLMPVKMTSAEAMKLVVSGGAIYPGEHGDKAQTSLIEKLTTATQKPEKKSP